MQWQPGVPTPSRAPSSPSPGPQATPRLQRQQLGGVGARAAAANIARHPVVATGDDARVFCDIPVLHGMRRDGGVAAEWYGAGCLLVALLSSWVLRCPRGGLAAVLAEQTSVLPLPASGRTRGIGRPSRSLQGGALWGKRMGAEGGGSHPAPTALLHRPAQQLCPPSGAVQYVHTLQSLRSLQAVQQAPGPSTRFLSPASSTVPAGGVGMSTQAGQREGWASVAAALATHHPG